MFFDTNWQALYRDRLNNADEVLRSVIENGNRIYIGSGCSEPQHLVRALVRMLECYQDLELVQHLSLGALPQEWGVHASRCRLKTFFVGPKTRRAVTQGLADYIPIPSSSIPRLFREEKTWALDVCLIQVSPPDEHGFCSLGVGVDLNKSAATSARVVVAQVNNQMPRALGDTFLHVAQFHHLVEHDEPLLEIIHRERSAVAERIAKYIVQLVDDGSTLQVGFGRVANSVLQIGRAHV